MDEERADLGRVVKWVEKVVVAVGPLICAVESLAFAPAATSDHDGRRLRFRRAIFNNQVGAVGDELGVDTEDGGERALSLRGSVVVRLKLTYGGFNQRTQEGEVRFDGGTDAEIRLHGGLSVVIVTAKRWGEFCYLLSKPGRRLCGRCLCDEEMAVRKWILVCAGLALLLSSEALGGQKSAVSASTTGEATRQTQTDEYTRYELLAPESGSFRIRYEVTATTAGAKSYYNPIRKGSVASDEVVYDAMTGEALQFEIVSGEEARKDPLMADADLGTNYIKVHLARPVPKEGQGRLIILKTYKDEKSYHRDADAIVFNRSLGIKRNSMVLPSGYEVIGCNVASQVLPEADGRIAVSFMNGSAGEAPLVVRARLGSQRGAAAVPRALTTAVSWEAPFKGETEKERLAERAHQDREIVYFLKEPESHAFRLYHDYTESRPGVDKYVNVVRVGSTVSEPSAYVLDTGEKLETQIMSGDQLALAKIDAGEPVAPTGQVVVVRFAPVKKGQSIRLRIWETYTTVGSYRLEEDELVFDRSLGRPRNAVVLPEGWYVTASAVPGTVSLTSDGRVRLDFWNGSPDPADVLIKGKRRVGSGEKKQSPF
jgi:hypothetical protein